MVTVAEVFELFSVVQGQVIYPVPTTLGRNIQENGSCRNKPVRAALKLNT